MALSAGFGVGLVFLIGRVVGELPKLSAGGATGDASGPLLWLLAALLLTYIGNAVAPVLAEATANRPGYLVMETAVRQAPAMLGDRLMLLGGIGLVGWFFSWWTAMILLCVSLAKDR